MEFIVKDLFDVNTGNRHRHVFERMSEELSVFFEERSYSPMVNRIVIDMICSIQFRMPYRKRPIYHEDKLIKVDPRHSGITYRLYHLIFIDILLPDAFSTSNTCDAIKIIEEALVRYFTDVPLPMKIRKSFDKERFISDLQSFFTNYKYETKTNGLENNG